MGRTGYRIERLEEGLKSMTDDMYIDESYGKEHLEEPVPGMKAVADVKVSTAVPEMDEIEVLRSSKPLDMEKAKRIMEGVARGKSVEELLDKCGVDNLSYTEWLSFEPMFKNGMKIAKRARAQLLQEKLLRWAEDKLKKEDSRSMTNVLKVMERVMDRDDPEEEKKVQGMKIEVINPFSGVVDVDVKKIDKRVEDE